MAIYMKFGDVIGPSTVKGFSKWIVLQHFGFAVRRDIGTAARGSLNREAAEPTFAAVQVLKRTDIATPRLLQDAWGGHLDTNVEIAFTTTTKDTVAPFLTIKLTGCGISNFSASGSGAGRFDDPTPNEQLTLNFTTIEVTHFAMNSLGTGSMMKAGYNLTKMSKM